VDTWWKQWRSWRMRKKSFKESGRFGLGFPLSHAGLRSRADYSVLHNTAWVGTICVTYGVESLKWLHF
jgi:hypothetical protein